MSGVNPAVTGAWLESHDPGDRQFLKIGDLQLESGEVLSDITNTNNGGNIVFN